MMLCIVDTIVHSTRHRERWDGVVGVWGSGSMELCYLAGL